MKKPILITGIILISFLGFNCKQHNGQGGPGYQSQSQGPVPNVNGNVPDTTNTVGMPGTNTDTNSVTNNSDSSIKK